MEAAAEPLGAEEQLEPEPAMAWGGFSPAGVVMAFGLMLAIWLSRLQSDLDRLDPQRMQARGDAPMDRKPRLSRPAMIN